MAHFAELDNTNTVIRVIVVDNNDILDADGNESEELGKQFCLQFGAGPWVQTSYNANFRKNYAGVGSTYDPVRDAFIPKKPHPDWVFDEETCKWVPPVPYPQDGKSYYWNWITQSWIEVNVETS